MNTESRQALTLTGVAAIFVLGHSLRFVISPVEFVWTKNNFDIQGGNSVGFLARKMAPISAPKPAQSAI